MLIDNNGITDGQETIAPSQPAEDDQSTLPKARQARSVEHFAAEFRNVRLSMFWKNRPRLWFIHLESEFNAYRMQSDDARYNAIVRHLDEEVIIAVADILEAPSATGKYDSLKEHLIKRFADSQKK